MTQVGLTTAVGGKEILITYYCTHLTNRSRRSPAVIRDASESIQCHMNPSDVSDGRTPWSSRTYRYRQYGDI